MALKSSMLLQALTNNAASYGSNRLRQEQDENGELSNDPFETVARLRTRYGESNVEPPKNKGVGTALGVALKVLDAPGNAVRGALQEGFTPGGRNAAEGAWKGLTGQNTYSTSDWLKNAGVKNKVVRGVGGFVGDVLLDPTTYIGGAGLVKSAAGGSLKGVAKKAGKEALGTMAERLAITLGGSADDIAKKLALKGVGATDDILSAGKKILNGADATAGNILEHEMLSKATNKAAGIAEKAAATELRTAGQKIIGDKKVSTELAKSLTSLLDMDPLAKPDTLKNILGGKIQPKNARDWEKIYGSLDTRFSTHIGRNPLDPAAAKQAREIIRGMNPDQLNTAFNVADEIGSQIIGADQVNTFNRLMNIVKSYSDPVKVGNALDARAVYRASVEAAGDATYELSLANGLHVAIDALGKRRVVGVQLPFSSKVFPLADITTLTQKLDPARSLVYNNVPGVQVVSDWWDKSIRGEATWGLNMAGQGFEYNGMKEVVSRYTRLKGSLPMQMEGYIKHAFGADFMQPQNAKVQRAIPYIVEGKMDLPDHSMAHKYMSMKLAPQQFSTDPEEIADMMADMAADIDPNMLRFLDERAASIGVLSDDELLKVEEISRRIKLSNDAMFQLEKQLGFVVQDVPGAKPQYKRGGEYMDEYIYHAFSNTGKKTGPGARMKGVTAKESGAIITTGNTTIFHSRDYPTIAHAIAGGQGFDPIDNIITLQAMRMSETVKHGIHKSILDGIDNVFGMADDARKGLDLEDVAPLSNTTMTPVVDTRKYPMTPAEILKRNSKLDKTKASLTQQLSDLQTQIKGVRYDEAKFGAAIKKDVDSLAAAQRTLAKPGLDPATRTKLETKVAAIQKHVDSVQKAVDDVNTGAIKPKRGRPTAEQQIIRDDYIMNTAKAPKKAIYHGAKGDVEVDIDYVGTKPTGEPEFAIKGTKKVVTGGQLTFLDMPPEPKIKPWDDIRVDTEFTPKQAALNDKFSAGISDIDTQLSDMTPMKERGYTRIETKVEDLEGAERTESLAARSAAEAVMQTFTDSVGGGEGLTAFKNLFRKIEDVPASARMGGNRDFVSVSGLFGTEGKYLVHKDVYPLMEQFNALVTGNDGLDTLLDLYDTGIRQLKTLQTTLNPSFVPRNFIGEATMSVLNGTTMKEFSTGQDIFKMLGGYTEVGSTKMFNTEAVLKLRLLRPGDLVMIDGVQKSAKTAVDDLISKLSVDVGGKPMYIEELFSNFIRTGLGQAGMLTETLSNDIPKVVQKLEHHGALRTTGAEFVQDLKGKKLTENFAVALPRLYKNLMRGGSEWTEQSFRLADYVHHLGKGLDWEDAAREVKKFHVDYADLTSFEKLVMRRAVPYYTFMRKNIPMQLRLLVERPGYYSAIGHMVSNANTAVDNPEAPDYLTQNLALPLFKDDDGTVTYLNWNLPLTDMARFTNDFQENMKGAVGSLTPFLRVPFEMATGETMMFGGKIDDPLKYIAGQMGGVNVLYKMLSGANSPDGDTKYARPGQVGAYGSLLPRTNPSQEELKKMYSYRDKLMEDMKKRKNKGEPIPAIADTAGAYEKSRLYAGERENYTAPHNRK